MTAATIATGRRTRAWLAGGLFLGVACTASGLLIERGGHVLGTATPPFVMGWLPRVDVGWALAAAVVLAAGVVAGPLAARRLSTPAFAVALFAFALSAGLALNAARSGTHGWDAIFDTGPRGSFEAKNEYLPGLPALSYGHRFFLDRFAELVPALPVNVAGHPPGLLLTADALGLTTPARFAALCIASAAACAPLTYWLARAFVADAVARVAGLLAAVSPGLLLFGVTSADAVYAALGTAAAALLVRPGWRARTAGSVVLAVAAFFSWALLAIGAFAVLVVWQRDGRRPAIALAALCALPRSRSTGRWPPSTATTRSARCVRPTRSTGTHSRAYARTGSGSSARQSPGPHRPAWR